MNHDEERRRARAMSGNRLTMTRRGKKMYRAGMDGLDAKMQLLMEVAARAPNITREHLEDLLDECVRCCNGDVDATLIAVKSGQIQIKRSSGR